METWDWFVNFTFPEFITSELLIIHTLNNRCFVLILQEYSELRKVIETAKTTDQRRLQERHAR